MPTASSPPKLVPTAAASAQSGLPITTLRTMTRQGLPCVRVGSKLYFDLDKLDAWLDAAAERSSVAAAAEVVAKARAAAEARAAAAALLGGAA
jgi:hypothetical protein